MKKSAKLKEKVLFLLDAINCDDYVSAGECLSDDFKYQEFLMTSTGPQKYLHRMKSLQINFKIQKIFAKKNSVCLFSDIIIYPCVDMYGCGLYEFSEDKIISLYQFLNPVIQIKIS